MVNYTAKDTIAQTISALANAEAPHEYDHVLG